MQQIGGALLLRECSEEGLETLVLCEACVALATPVEMELAGPQSHPLLALMGLLGESLECLVSMGDQPTMHPEQWASEDDQC